MKSHLRPEMASLGQADRRRQNPFSQANLRKVENGMKWFSPIAPSCTPTSIDALARRTSVCTEERARRVAVVKTAIEAAANRARVWVAVHVHRRALAGSLWVLHMAAYGQSVRPGNELKLPASPHKGSIVLSPSMGLVWPRAADR